MFARDICLWVHSLRTWRYSESKDKDDGGSEVVNIAIKYLFEDENMRRFLVVAYKNVTKRVANVKNDIYRHENPSLRV